MASNLQPEACFEAWIIPGGIPAQWLHSPVEKAFMLPQSL